MGWWILLGLLGLLLILLLIPVVAHVSFRQEAQAELSWLFFRWKLYPLPEEEEAQPEEEETAAPQPAKKKKKVAKGEKMSFPQMVSLVLDVGSKLLPLVGKLCRHIVFYDLHLRILVAGEDAAVTAINCGRYNGWIGGVYATLQHLFTLKDPDIVIRPDFTGTETQIDFRCKIRLRPLIALVMAIRMAAVFFISLIQHKDNQTQGGVKYESTSH